MKKRNLFFLPLLAVLTGCNSVSGAKPLLSNFGQKIFKCDFTKFNENVKEKVINEGSLLSYYNKDFVEDFSITEIDSSKVSTKTVEDGKTTEEKSSWSETKTVYKYDADTCSVLVKETSNEVDDEGVKTSSEENLVIYVKEDRLVSKNLDTSEVKYLTGSTAKDYLNAKFLVLEVEVTTFYRIEDESASYCAFGGLSGKKTRSGSENTILGVTVVTESIDYTVAKPNSFDKGSEQTLETTKNGTVTTIETTGFEGFSVKGCSVNNKKYVK